MGPDSILRRACQLGVPKRQAGKTSMQKHFEQAIEGNGMLMDQPASRLVSADVDQHGCDKYRADLRFSACSPVPIINTTKEERR